MCPACDALFNQSGRNRNGQSQQHSNCALCTPQCSGSRAAVNNGGATMGVIRRRSYSTRPPISMRDWWTPTELGRELGVSRDIITQLCRKAPPGLIGRSTLGHWQLGPRARKVLRDQILKRAQERRIPQPEAAGGTSDVG
jgi:hypothetical protein